MLCAASGRGNTRLCPRSVRRDGILFFAGGRSAFPFFCALFPKEKGDKEVIFMMIRMQGVTFAYPGSGENVFENLSFTIDTEWKTALIGRNGRGKPTLLRLLEGDRPPCGRGTLSPAHAGGDIARRHGGGQRGGGVAHPP